MLQEGLKDRREKEETTSHDSGRDLTKYRPNEDKFISLTWGWGTTCWVNRGVTRDTSGPKWAQLSVEKL